MGTKHLIRHGLHGILFCLVYSIFMSCSSVPQGNRSSEGSAWHWENGSVVVEAPVRPAGQQHALNMTAPKLEAVHIGVVGLGMRGRGSAQLLTYIPGVQIVALCDHEKERAESSQNILRSRSMPKAAIYYGAEGYKELCRRKDIDLVYIAADWIHHFPIARYALEHGKHVAIEVPSAMNLKQCWELVNLCEKNRKHCMMLENCCYDWFEMTSLNMAQQGVFGELLYAQGAYIHYLAPYWNRYWKKDKEDKLGWRLRYNKDHRGDVYATHGLGPVAQAMDIHRGDRIVKLVAMDTKSAKGKKYVEQMSGQACDSFRNGDHTVTLMRTLKGKMIQIQHNVMDPRPYNRLYQLTGTLGFANKYPIEGFAINMQGIPDDPTQPVNIRNSNTHNFISAADMKKVMERFEHPISRKYEEIAKAIGGHGGMDFIMNSRLIYCLQNGLPLDMDVYDLAEWCCLSELGAISMDNGCVPVVFPDFTRGYWNIQQGYRHAFATPADEKIAEEKALEFTRELQERGAKEWAQEK